MAGSIQGDINQALGTLGVLSQFSPQLKEHAENIAESRKLDKRQKVLNERSKVAIEDLREKFTPDASGEVVLDPLKEDLLDQARKEMMAINQEQEDISRARYDLKPSLKRYQDWQLDASINQDLKNEYADIARQKEAMAKMSRQTEAKKAQKRNFMDYLSKMPMYGETVGSIDARNPGFAKQIASQYDKNARRRMMNQMDREAKDGKQ